MTRVLVVGWPSFTRGEATVGDVLGMEAVRDELTAAGIDCDLAWSPVFRPGTAQAGGATPRADLAALPVRAPVPVVAVILVQPQEEYGDRGRHDEVSAEITDWLRTTGCAVMPLSTRLDRADWRLQEDPAQFESLIRRVDLVVTTRLHGLVLALKNGVPVLAVDPVAGGAKVSAQAHAWNWPAVVTLAGDGIPVADQLARWRDWCLSAEGEAAALKAAQSPPPTPLEGLRGALRHAHG